MIKGNLKGKILVIQDQPTKDDLENESPFSGPAGWRIKNWIQDAGGQINDCLFIDWDDYSIVSMHDFRVVVPLGETSLSHFIPGKANLDKLRGSIYNVGGSKVIPSIHPKEIRFNPIWERRCRIDWVKIIEESNLGEFTAPIRNHNISPDISDIKHFVKCLGRMEAISMDIETWGGTIKCIGFAANERESIVIPTEESYWKKRTGDELDIHNAWDLIQRICEHPVEKIMQNGLFDSWWLEEYGIPVANYVWDTLSMHHALWPRDNHALHYLASIYTKQPYWKDEAKDADEIVRVAKQGMDKLYVYNGLDCTVTYEIWRKLKTELVEGGRLNFYHKHYAGMHTSLLSIMRTGVRVDRTAMDAMRVHLLADAIRLRDEATKLVGEPLFIFDKTNCEKEMLRSYLYMSAAKNQYSLTLEGIKNFLSDSGHKVETIERKWNELQDKGISDDKLREVIINFGLPKAATGATKTGKMKVDNISLRKIQKYYEERKSMGDVGAKVHALIDLVLEHRRKRKLASFLTDSKIDSDDRLRCTYKFTTKTGRLASSANPRGTGMNLQNIDRTLRNMFIASQGRVLLEIDLSRAENRVVGALTGVDYMIDAARRPTTGIDVYKERTAGIYSVLWDREVTIEEVTTEMRRLGKEVVLASAYGMRGHTFSDRVLKTLGLTLTPPEAQKLLDADMQKQPAILQWQSEVRRVIMRDRCLFTSWGRMTDFAYDRMDDETYRFAYAYVPQSEVGDLCNQWMIRPLHAALLKHKMKSQIVLQVHDAVIVDAVPEELHSIMQFIQKSVTRPRKYGQVFGREIELSIPCEFALGKTWKKSHEFKTLPTKEEVAEVVKEILNASV